MHVTFGKLLQRLVQAKHDRSFNHKPQGMHYHSLDRVKQGMDARESGQSTFSQELHAGTHISAKPKLPQQRCSAVAMHSY